MHSELGIDAENLAVARRWCEMKGPGWVLGKQLGQGGTAPVFEIVSPSGLRALKLYDAKFSVGEKGDIERKRIDQQLALCGHDCPSLVQVYDGGVFDDRLYLVMARAAGKELEKCLKVVPRDRIRHIVDQVARAALFLKSRDLCHRDIKSANVFISDDFDQVTLLDISVIREISDPVGVGTDHDGQLPIVATARYSPPEYLFRLLEPGPELWHALNIYQLGGLLHDLIMQEPLFESEYLKSTQNRYRFAWIVATTTPKIQADDVDQDLVYTAGRALDKDWARRSSLTLEDFLANASVRQAHSLQFLGLMTEQTTVQRSDNVASTIVRVRDVAKGLDEAISDRLRRKGATTLHLVEHGGDDESKLLTFRWNAPKAGDEATPGSIELRVTLGLDIRFGRWWFGNSAQLSTMIGGEQREAMVKLPDVEDGSGAVALLANQVESALGSLAEQLSQAQLGDAGR